MKIVYMGFDGQTQDGPEVDSLDTAARCLRELEPLDGFPFPFVVDDGNMVGGRNELRVSRRHNLPESSWGFGLMVALGGLIVWMIYAASWVSYRRRSEIVTGDDCEEPRGCAVPPVGWKCTRTPGHDGPCAAIPDDDRACSQCAGEIIP